jgi:hypothetical protein
MTTSEFLQDIATRRGPPNLGGNPHRFVELVKGSLVPTYFYEPDPDTSRDKYYYNTRTNTLYSLVKAINPVTGCETPVWKKISVC